ncbi:hypothetical protein SELMODRAFT_430859 [Selaginella moellendorffii]|uniref:Uncharacterized protein n=1 Tax=Selaginella moellendorffii TaxID=88036 RepID=D8TAR5_SELML|nr:hypothetical protein SELMODRAFT_430859 [Selaginella moellendorffii]
MVEKENKKEGKRRTPKDGPRQISFTKEKRQSLTGGSPKPKDDPPPPPPQQQQQQQQHDPEPEPKPLQPINDPWRLPCGDEPASRCANRESTMGMRLNQAPWRESIIIQCQGAAAAIEEQERSSWRSSPSSQGSRTSPPAVARFRRLAISAEAQELLDILETEMEEVREHKLRDYCGKLSTDIVVDIVVDVLNHARDVEATIQFFDWCHGRHGYTHTAFAFNRLLEFLVNKRQYKRAHQMLIAHSKPSSFQANAVTYSTIVRGYCEDGETRQAGSGTPGTHEEGGSSSQREALHHHSHASVQPWEGEGGSLPSNKSFQECFHLSTDSCDLEQSFAPAGSGKEVGFQTFEDHGIQAGFFFSIRFVNQAVWKEWVSWCVEFGVDAPYEIGGSSSPRTRSVLPQAEANFRDASEAARGAKSAPFLGAPDALKGVLSGVTFGLPISEGAARIMLRTFSSGLWMLPFSDDKPLSQRNTTKTKGLVAPDWPVDVLEVDMPSSGVVYPGEFLENGALAALANYTVPIQRFYSAQKISDGTSFKEMGEFDPQAKLAFYQLKKYYLDNPLFNPLTPWERLPIENVFCMYGINLKTEVGYQLSPSGKPYPIIKDVIYETDGGSLQTRSGLDVDGKGGVASGDSTNLENIYPAFAVRILIANDNGKRTRPTMHGYHEPVFNHKAGNRPKHRDPRDEVRLRHPLEGELGNLEAIVERARGDDRRTYVAALCAVALSKLILLPLPLLKLFVRLCGQCEIKKNDRFDHPSARGSRRASIRGLDKIWALRARAAASSRSRIHPSALGSP